MNAFSSNAAMLELSVSVHVIPSAGVVACEGQGCSIYDKIKPNMNRSNTHEPRITYQRLLFNSDKRCYYFKRPQQPTIRKIVFQKKTKPELFLVM